MTRLNCPNCGAPIDIHRRSCEYCGTPYDLEDREVFYADNQPIYIHQEPIKWNDNQYATLAKRLADASARAGTSFNDLNNSIQNLQSKLNYVNSQTWQAEQIRECVNAYPRAESNSSTADCVPGIWEDPVCPEHSMLKDILLLLAMCAPVIVFIILKALNII